MVGCYIHVPFCARRCGYCDFNTAVLGSAGLTPNGWLAGLRAEIALVAPREKLGTVFFGGGTPTLLGGPILAAAMDMIRGELGLASASEVTIEVNPETVTAPLLDALLAAGFTRLSLGMQSADPAVLAVLDRAHTPGQVTWCVDAARRAGFTDISLDLIYGTPGETLTSWQHTLETALACAPTHISCYALIVEPGTPLAGRIDRGELAAPDDDLQADEYLLADDLLTAAGLGWYELSNWAAPGHECRHNLGYWHSADWLGFGPGAHSHVGLQRWWNHRSPRRWAAALQRGESPVEGREILDDAMIHEERVLLQLRLATGLEVSELMRTERERLPGFMADALLITHTNSVVLTRQGRLLADKVVRDLLS